MEVGFCWSYLEQLPFQGCQWLSQRYQIWDMVSWSIFRYHFNSFQKSLAFDGLRLKNFCLACLSLLATPFLNLLYALQWWGFPLCFALLYIGKVSGSHWLCKFNGRLRRLSERVACGSYIIIHFIIYTSCTWAPHVSLMLQRRFMYWDLRVHPVICFPA